MAVDLGTVLGALLAEVTRARMRADLETARMVDLYAADPLLKHMPVPRFRLPVVDVTLPIVVDEVEGSEGAPGAPKLPSVTKRKSMVAGALKYANLTLKPAERSAILKAMDAEFERVGASPSALRGGAISRKIRASVDRSLAAVSDGREGSLPSGEARRFSEALERAVSDDLNRQIPATHRMRVLPRTQDVQGVPDGSNVMQLRFTISEESYQLSLSDDGDGEVIEHFGPE